METRNKARPMTGNLLRQHARQILVVSRGLAELPRTEIDAVSIDILRDIESSDELLELCRRWLAEPGHPSTTGMSDDTKISWPRIRDWMPHLKRALEKMA